jgi:hypothetical protein
LGVKLGAVRSAGGTLSTARLHRCFVLIAAAVCLPACGPTATVNRAELTGDAGRPRDARTNPPPEQPPAGPFQPPSGPSPGGQGGGPIDPVRSPDGFACTMNNECLSQKCADGVCCNEACDGACRSCDQTGNAGKCLPVPVDQDPDNECPEEAPASCGKDGACDGAGACRFHPAGSMCEPGGCEVATERSARLCDGKGTCLPTTTKSCLPAMCIGDACAPPCVMDADCPAGRWCDSGTCRTQRDPGMPCERAAQCGSNFCTDGVCCNMACKDSCYACNQPGMLGQCMPVPTGQDPGSECPVEAIGTCGNLGGCNGRGACLKHPVGTFCGYGQCMNRTQFGNSTCDGMGGCRRGPGMSCGNYACNGTLVCWTVCANNAQCAPGRTCNIHACQ